jgi:hypothetical protein
MLSHRLRQGEKLGLQPPPRDLELYPRDVHADFRRLDHSTLRKLSSYFGTGGDIRKLSSTELARRVARQFADMEVEEQDTLSFFVEYTVALGGATGGMMEEVAKRNQLNARRLRKRTRRPGDESSDEGGNDVPVPVRGRNTNSSSAAAAATAAAAAAAAAARAENNLEKYCLCKRVSFGEMIACDDPDCEIEWFHVSCVGLKEGEMRGEWYCPNCTARREAKANHNNNNNTSGEGGRPTRRARTISIEKDDGIVPAATTSASTTTHSSINNASKSTWRPGGRGGGGQRRLRVDE